MNFYSDLDGVWLNFYLHICKKFGRPVKTINQWEEPWIGHKFPLITDDEEFWKTIPALNDPYLLKDLPIKGFVTACPMPMAKARAENLKRLGFPDLPIIVTGHNKLETLKQLKCDLFIDDRLSTVKQLTEGGIRCIYYQNAYSAIFTPPHIPVIRNLDDIKYFLYE